MAVKWVPEKGMQEDWTKNVVSLSPRVSKKELVIL